MLSRVEELNKILDEIPKEALVVCCNGKLGRELFELRETRGEPHTDFIIMGSMGCAIAVALGVSLNIEKKVYCLLGDGNLLMKLGSLATALKYDKGNLEIIVFNNRCHDSTGGQPTSFEIIKDKLSFMTLRVIDIEPGCSPTLSRPTLTSIQIKKNFIKHAKTPSNIQTNTAKPDPTELQEGDGESGEHIVV